MQPRSFTENPNTQYDDYLLGFLKSTGTDSELKNYLLCGAAFFDLPQSTNYLLNNGANPKAIMPANIDLKTFLKFQEIMNFTGLTKNLSISLNLILTDKYPLELAIITTNLETAQLLVNAGADVNASYYKGSSIFANKTSLLYQAVERNVVKQIEFLIKNGADVNLADDHGNTPLHRAAKANNIEVVKLLLAANANVELRAHGNHNKKAKDLTTSKEIKSLIEAKSSHDNKHGIGITNKVASFIKRFN